MNSASDEKQLAVRPVGVPGQLVLVPPGPGSDGVAALAKRTKDGDIHSLQVTVPLNIQKGHVWKMGRWDPESRTVVPDYAVTALGYDRLNSVAGVAILKPPTLHIDDGRIVPNPYFERVRETDEIRRVRVRMVGIGRSSVGNLVAHDVTLSYDLGNYLAQDIWSKWTGKKKDAPKAWGKVYPFGRAPDNIKQNPQFLCIAIPTGVALYVDLTNKDVLSVISEHIGKQKFAERNAETICKRNVLARFFAVRRVHPADNGLFYVTFIAWPESDRDLGRIADMAAQAQEGRIEVDGEEVEVASAAVVPGNDDVNAALGGEVDEDQGSAAGEDDSAPEPASVAPQVPPPEAAIQSGLNVLRAQIRQLMDQIRPEQREAACQAANVPGPTALGHVEDQAVLLQVRQELLKRGARPKGQQARQAPTTPNGPSTKAGG